VTAREVGGEDAFAASRGRFEELVGFLDGAEAAGLEHAELESVWTPTGGRCCAG
jgi:hypothetical protein